MIPTDTGRVEVLAQELDAPLDIIY